MTASLVQYSIHLSLSLSLSLHHHRIDAASSVRLSPMIGCPGLARPMPLPIDVDTLHYGEPSPPTGSNLEAEF